MFGRRRKIQRSFYGGVYVASDVFDGETMAEDRAATSQTYQ